jgi:hypothetical protein
MTTRDLVKRELTPLLVIAALALGMMWRVTLAGRVMAPADLLLLMEPWKHHAGQFPEFHQAYNPILDAIQQFYPWRQYAGQSLRSGLVPLWNPYELCGNPFVGNNQSAVFYPETWLHALMPTERALGWATVLHFFASGALMYWFLRVLRLRRPAALIGAIAFMFNGFFVGWLCLPSFRSVPAWLPGMLAAFELTARRRHWQWLALCALLVGLQFLAGNLHISLLVLIVFVAYVLFRSAQVLLTGERRAALALAGGAAVAVLVGILVAAIQLLPVVELAPMSSRAGGSPYTAMLTLATPWPLLLTGLMPDLFGNPVDYNHWGAELGRVYRAYTETTWYVGVLPWLLLAAPFLRLRQSSPPEGGGARGLATPVFWLAMLLLGIALAFGTPVYALFYYLVPGAKALSGLGRAIVISTTALSVLSALGLDALLQLCSDGRGAQVRTYAAIAGGVLAAIGLLAGGLVWVRTGALEESLPGLGAYTSGQIMRFALLLALSAAAIALLSTKRRPAVVALVLVLSADLYLYVAKFTPATRPEYLHIRTSTVDLIRADPAPVRILSLGRDAIRRMAPNTPMIVGLQDIQGSDSLEVGVYRRLLNAVCHPLGGSGEAGAGFPQPDPSLPAVGLLGAKYVISGLDLGDAPDLTLISTSEGRLYRNLRACPRAFTVGDGETVATPDEALQRVISPDFDASKVAVFAASDAPRGESPPHAQAACTVSYAGPDRATVAGNFRPGDVLLLADTYYPGWRAYQDGRECPILRADYALRAVRIDQPCERIDFVYLPASFRTGAFASLCALGLLAGIAASVLARRRR